MIKTADGEGYDDTQEEHNKSEEKDLSFDPHRFVLRKPILQHFKVAYEATLSVSGTEEESLARVSFVFAGIDEGTVSKSIAGFLGS